MKKGCLLGGGLALLALVVVMVIWGVGIHNNIIPKDNAAKQQWGNVETAYQKRSDLIPQLVNTVKGAKDFEQETLTQVIEARAKATQTTIDPTNLTPENIAQFQQAQDGLAGALSKLMVVIERYPDLKANQNFLSLQTSLESIAEEVRFEQVKFNDAARVYNDYILTIPNRFIANFGGFTEKGYFQAQKGAEVAPEVNF
ncbi:MAG: LemA family protein [Moheibacter sp.]